MAQYWIVNYKCELLCIISHRDNGGVRVETV